MKVNKEIVVLKGDGIGPEVVDQALKVLAAIGRKFDHSFKTQEYKFGASSIDAYGEPLTEETLKACKDSDAILLGAIGDPKYDNDPNNKIRPEQGLLKLRKSLELFSNVRPIVVYDKLVNNSTLKAEIVNGVDFVIFRELTSGIYFGEKKSDGHSASDLCYYNDFEIERICKLAFEEAQKRDNKLCLVDKANVLESSRLWRKVFQSLANQYPEVKVDYLFVDNAAMQLILNPKQFDVIVTSNMFGDILSDAASVLTGSLGLLPSSSIGTYGKMYEPVHGSFPQAAGKDLANPMATILSLEMMLSDMDLSEEANSINSAINDCMRHNILTAELKKTDAYKCSEVGDFITDHILHGLDSALSNHKKKESISILN